MHAYLSNDQTFNYSLFCCALISIVWLLLVLGACSFFIWFMTDRVMYLASYPKAVDVEVIYTESVRFPAVTICNQNLFRFIIFSHITRTQLLGLIFGNKFFVCG